MRVRTNLTYCNQIAWQMKGWYGFHTCGALYVSGDDVWWQICMWLMVHVRNRQWTLWSFWYQRSGSQSHISRKWTSLSGCQSLMCIFGPSLISRCVQLRNFVYSLTSFRYGIISDQRGQHNLSINIIFPCVLATLNAIRVVQGSWEQNCTLTWPNIMALNAD
jgi:hypothetical protein